jgi:hypothetical protein
VNKRRWMRKFDTEPREVREIPLNAKEAPISGGLPKFGPVERRTEPRVRRNSAKSPPTPRTRYGTVGELSSLVGDQGTRLRIPEGHIAEDVPPALTGNSSPGA